MYLFTLQTLLLMLTLTLMLMLLRLPLRMPRRLSLSLLRFLLPLHVSEGTCWPKHLFNKWSAV
jgi:hypothetical protein